MTRSEEGMTLHVDGDAPVHVPAYPVKVRDVSGAGDTVVAVMAAHAGAGRRFRIRDARRQCRRRGGGRQARHRDGVGRRIARAHPAGGDARAGGEDRVRLGGARRAARASGAQQGLRIGFTNGCFDLLHPGHVKLLAERARRLRPAGGRAQQRRLGARGSRARAGRSSRSRRAPRCWRRSRRSISSSCSRRTRRSN